MEVLMRTHSPVQYSPDTAHTIEVTREEDENGEFGSFGFTLLYEKPPIVGTIVPGGPAQSAGLKKNDIVLIVNGTDVTHFPHQKVVSLISQTPTASVWLKVCDPDTKSPANLGHALGAFSGAMSSSTPNFPRGVPTGGSHRRPRGVVGGAAWEPPPKYSEVTQPSRPHPGSAGIQLGPRVGVAGGVANMSPLNRQVLMPSPKLGSLSSSPHLGGSGPLPQNGYAPARQPPPSSDCYTSASVMVLYIGPVEIPETWSTRGISSKCIQECTRRLLSQRQEFIEAFLEVSVSSMKVLNVSRNVLYQHKREELFYCGACTDDEQYFAIVTRRLDPKLVDPEVGQTLHMGERPTKGHMCHVFQVIRNKSILVLHAGDRGGEAPAIKPKTVQILSCLTIIKAIEALFIGDATGGAVSSAQLLGGDPGISSSSSTSFRSIGSAESAGSFDNFSSIYGGGGGGAGPDKKRRKDVVDLRPSAFGHLHNSTTYGSTGGVGGHAHLPQDPAHQRSRDYLHPMDTPAFSAMGSTSRSWYKMDSPREGGGHSRQGSYELASRPDSAGYYEPRCEAQVRQKQESHRVAATAAFDKVKKISDESSISSHSSGGGASSPHKMAPPTRGSASPSPSKSLSHSPGSRSRSPSPLPRSKHPHHTHRDHHPHRGHHSHQEPRAIPTAVARRRMMLAYHTPSKLSAGMALEMGSLRSGALSPTSSTVGSTVSRYRSTLRRQGSESSVMDLNQAVDGMRSGAALPGKNSLITSSHGSIMTVTTVAEEEGQQPEEVGRVAGWIASFDKLLEDPLGVTCLQQFLEKEHCEENVLFWKEAREFSQKVLQMAPAQAQAAAKKIYDQYLSPSSPHTVNVDDRALKAVESRLGQPTPNIFAEAQEQIYQLLKMDCYMRFKRSDLVKECLLADMEGVPLPIGPVTPVTKNPWKRQKEFGFSRSLFGRFGRSRVPPSPPLQPAAPRTKKDSKSGVKESPGSRRTSRGDSSSSEKKRSSTDIARGEEFPPEKHLDILQEHKGNIFEVNLPNKVTKIMEVPKKGSVREAIQPVLKKNNYSLDVMDLKFADTLKPVSLDSTAHILVGQHIIVLKSAQTFTATFPDESERILPADQTPVQQLVAGVLREIGTLQNFSVYLENSRVPFNGTIEASTLVGQKVTVKYLGGQYMPADSNMDDLFHMIERLAGDTLEDQRTSPTPRNTPEPASPASSDRGPPPPELQQRTRSHGSFRLSPRSSDSSPETRGKLRGRAGSTREKKPLMATRSIGQVSSERRSPGGREDPPPPPSSSRRFKRTQSGAVISKRQPFLLPTNFKRTYSPPAAIGKPSPSPPPPTSRPPPLPPTHHHLNVGGGAYGSTPDTLNRGGRGYSPGGSGDSAHHPLDSIVREAATATAGSHGRQHSMPVQMPPPEDHTSSSSSGYSGNSWHRHQMAEYPPNPNRYTQQQPPRTAAQRHNLTHNPDLMRTGDQLVQREIDDYHRQQQLTSSLTSSLASDGSSSSLASRARVTLSPSTHILLPPQDDEEHHQQTETFV